MLIEIFVYVNLVFNLLFTGFLGLVFYRVGKQQSQVNKVKKQSKCKK